MLECVFDGGEVAVGNICALAARAIRNDVIVKEASFFKNGSEFGGDGSVYEGIKVMEEGDGSSVDGVGFGNEGTAALAST